MSNCMDMYMRKVERLIEEMLRATGGTTWQSGRRSTLCLAR